MKPKALSIFTGLALLMVVPMARAAQPYPVFQVDPSWPKLLPHGYIFGPSGGVTVDSHDHVWIYSRPATVRVTLNNPPDETNGQPAPSVVELGPDGRFIQGWGGVLAMSESERTHFDWPVQEHGIAVDSKGNVWVCGNGHDGKTGRDDDQCLKFTHDGKFLMQIGHSGKGKGSLDTENLGHPSQPVYWPKTNELFVSDGYANRRSMSPTPTPAPSDECGAPMAMCPTTMRRVTGSMIRRRSSSTCCTG